MRLCYVASLQSVHTERWVRYFEEQGHEVHVVTPVRPLTPPAGVDVTVLPTIRTGVRALDFLLGAASAPVQIMRYRRTLRRLRPDLVHIHYLNDAAWFAARAGGRPLVTTAWGSDVLIGAQRSILLRWLVADVLKRSDLITCDAEHLREAMVRLGAAREKIHIVYFGTDVRRFSIRPADPGLRARLGIGSAPIIVSLRRLDPLYDVGTLVAALALVAHAVGDVHAVIAGTGDEEQSLKARAADLGLDDRVHFVGHLPESDLPAYLAMADVYVSTALSDGGLAASTAEAMASGVPVIVTDVAANRDWIRHGVNGFLVPARDPDALARCLTDLLARPQERRRVGEEGRRVIVERNNWEIQMAHVAELYEEVVRGVDVQG